MEWSRAAAPLRSRVSDRLGSDLRNRRLTVEAFSKTSDGFSPKAPGGMIVDDPNRLHPGVDDHGPGKFEPTFPESLRDLLGKGAFRGTLAVVLDRVAARHLPDKSGKV